MDAEHPPLSYDYEDCVLENGDRFGGLKLKNPLEWNEFTSTTYIQKYQGYSRMHVNALSEGSVIVYMSSGGVVKTPFIVNHIQTADPVPIYGRNGDGLRVITKFNIVAVPVNNTTDPKFFHGYVEDKRNFKTVAYIKHQYKIPKEHLDDVTSSLSTIKPENITKSQLREVDNLLWLKDDPNEIALLSDEEIVDRFEVKHPNMVSTYI